MKRQAIVTTSWDDGHKLDLKLAKLLKKYGIKGTFYIAPENHEWDKRDLLSNSKIKQLSQDFEIGTHTMTHPDLTKISSKQARKEISESKKYLENILGKKIISFCYPKGKYNSQIKVIVKKSGLKIARTTKRFMKEIGDDPLALPTTIHAYTYLKDLKNFHLLLNHKTIRWDILAKKYFDYIANRGSVFHLWGHSWEIDENNDWVKLERILSYISRKTDIRYLENKEVFEATK